MGAMRMMILVVVSCGGDSCHSNLTGCTLEACVELVLVIFRNIVSVISTFIFQQANLVDCTVVLIAMQ